MRSSRISKDTSKLFDRVAAPTPPPRRTTRSLTRFALAKTEPAGSPRKLDAPPPDIEDGVGPPAKRRRRAVDDPPMAVKTEAVEQTVAAVLAPDPPSRAKGRARRPARRTIDPDTGAPAVPPPDWEDMYRAVERMRAPGGLAHGAPVDTMGCERLADGRASPREQRFHTLVALMLSSQTKDTVNAVAMHRLKTELPAHKPGAPPGLNLDNMLAVDPALLNQLIWAVGFHKNKTKFLKQAAVVLRDEWNGDIPNTIAGLTSLPGVGPKMAYLCMSAAWDVTLGIGVDVHVHRITNLWGWHNTKTPEETRLALESWLPRDKWRQINWLLVGFGQEICRPVGRRCGDCDLGLDGLCKAAERKKVVAGRTMKTRVETEVEDGAGGAAQWSTETVVQERALHQIEEAAKTSPLWPCSRPHMPGSG